MKKRQTILLCALFSFILPSCNGQNNISKSYSYYDPNNIQTIEKYSVELIENDFIDVSLDKTQANRGEYVNLTINDIDPGYKFLGWYINGVYRGEENTIKVQIFENTQIEPRFEKTEKVSRVGFSVGGQMIRHVFTDYSLTLTQDVFDSIVSMVSYLPYGYSIVGWNDSEGKEYKDGDVISESTTLYPIYEIEEKIQQFQYSVEVLDGDVINADSFKSVNGQTLTMGTILTFTALDENGNLDESKVWVDENGEIYSYKPQFTMTLVRNLKLHTIDKLMVDTTLPIIQSSDILVEHYMTGTPYEYVDLRLYVRVVIPNNFEHYKLISDYGAKMERIDITGARQRASFPLNKSQWNINGEAWCGAEGQSINYSYKGSGFIALEEFEEGFICDNKLYVESDSTVYNNYLPEQENDGWNQELHIYID